MNIGLNTFIVGIGAGLGGASRFLVGYWISSLSSSSFPFGTFIVNILGSFLIGLILENTGLSDSLRYFAAVGFLGGFTTFSAVSFELMSMLRSGQFLLSIAYMFLTCLVGLLACWLGAWVMSKISGY